MSSFILDNRMTKIVFSERGIFSCFYQSFGFVSFVFVWIIKITIFFWLQKSRSVLFANGLLAIPGILYVDSVLAVAFYVGFRITQKSSNILIRKSFTVLAVLSVCWQSLLGIMVIAYYYESSNFIDWFALASLFSEDWETILSYLKAFSYMFLAISIIFAVVIGVKVFIAFCIVSRSKQYNLIIDQETDTARAAESKRKRGHIFKIAFMAASFLSYYFLIESHSEMAKLAENYLVSPPLLFLERAIRRLQNQRSSEQNPSFETLSLKSRSTLVESKVKAKNVVILFMESLRSDILNFDPDKANGSHLASMLGKPEYIENFNKTFSPFLNELKKRSLFFPEAYTVAGYTIKSLLSSICSVYPLTGMTTEYRQDKKIYAPCLPEVLKEHNFLTSYFQPSTMNFDHQDLLMEKLGFDQKKTVEDLPKQEWLNYFGVDDRKMLSTLLDFVRNAKFQNKPFLASFLTNAAHHPFSLPKNFTKVSYTKPDPKFQVPNDYLNAVNNVDSFVKELFESFRKNGFLKDTLFVIIGDHGMGLGDHGVTGSGEGPFEESLKVPLFFYMDNYDLSKLHQSNHKNVANIDILPTILDFLRIETRKPWEGLSLIQPMQNLFESRILYQVTNPINYHSQVIRQGNRKLVFNVREETYRFFDLAEDPAEKNGVYLPNNNLKEKDVEWIEMAKDQIYRNTKEIAKKYQTSTE